MVCRGEYKSHGTYAWRVMVNIRGMVPAHGVMVNIRGMAPAHAVMVNIRVMASTHGVSW